MNMTPGLRKLALLAHITFSVGWFGAVIPYLALVVAGLVGRDAQMIQAACLAMEWIGWYVIVPFSLAALLSGLVQSLFTPWGLFRHWWILAKLVLTVVAVVILWQHMHEVSRIAQMAQGTMRSSVDLRPDLIHASGGLMVLFAAMALSVFKPWGPTPNGRRRASSLRTTSNAAPVRRPIPVTAQPRWLRLVGIHVAHVVVLGLLLVVILHISGGGLSHH